MLHHVCTLCMAMLLTLVPSSNAAAQEAAPLPPGYSPSGSPPVRGLYAAVAGLSSVYDAVELDELAEACSAKGREVTTEGEELRTRAGDRIYRTARAVAVIRDRLQLRTNAETCVARYSLVREATVRKGAWKEDDVPYFEKLPLPCKKRSLLSRCTRDVIAGITVTCINDGDGLVGSYRCVSERRDLSRGLLAGYGTYVDDGSTPTGSWTLDEIKLDVPINPAVFDEVPR